jgi:UDPglucose 6-dehydrogenase
MRVTVVGAGYVGLASALAFAAGGHDVVCVERDPMRLARLRSGEDPLDEPSVASLLETSKARFVAVDTELDRAEIVVVAVGTPMRRDGHADLTQLLEACRGIAAAAQPGTVVAIRSTVPVGTCDRLQDGVLHELVVVSNPEFLREGHALEDSLWPTRIVAGGPDSARAVIDALYAPIVRRAGARGTPPILWMTSRSAELAKYAANGFLATKLSFVNELANLAGVVGADADAVLRSMSFDPRIGSGHLRPGLGWGGSCFPKDTRALAALAAGEGYDFIILKAAIEQNSRQIAHFARTIERATARDATIALLGLAFKAGTADTRDSPALALADRLARKGRKVRAYDPAVRHVTDPAIAVAASAAAACADADALVVATEWPEFADLDLVALRGLMRGDLLVDGRGVIDPERARSAGFRYRGIGWPRRPMSDDRPSVARGRWFERYLSLTRAAPRP